MAYDFFTADLHLGGANIIGYCSRPFKNVDDMNVQLIGNVNERCKLTDHLYHLGDFCNYGRNKGVEGSRIKPKDYEKLMLPRVTHILGNHDFQNKLRAVIDSAFLRFGKFSVFASHKPPWDTPWADIVPDFYMCGHVHEKWKFNTHNGKLVINVGCDVWNYRPVRKDELLSCYEKFKRGTLELK